MAAEWRELRVGDLVDQGALMISDGYRMRNEELGSEGIPFVRGGDIGDGWINTDTEDHIRQEFVDRVRAKVSEPGDAAFITKGTVGRAGRLRPGQPPVVFAPQVAYWRVIDRQLLDPGFIYYLMKSHAFQSALDGVKTHGAMAADYVSISQQHDFRFQFPGIETQRAISHILGALDDKIELNRRISQTLEAMARTLFKSWFVDFDPVRAKSEGRDPGLPQPLADLFPDSFEQSGLGQIPKGWKVATIEDLADIDKGLSYKGECLTDEGGLPLVNLGCFSGGGIFNAHKIKRYRGKYKQRHTVSIGDLVIANTDVTQNRVVLGSPALVPEVDGEQRLLFTHHTFAFRFRQGSESWRRYVYFALLEPRFREIAEGFATGTTVLALPRDGVLKYSIPLPPFLLLAAFERQVECLLAAVDAGHKQEQTLAALRNALLPRLFSANTGVNQAPVLGKMG